MVFFENFFEVQKNFHQRAFSKIPFSVGDLFYIFLAIILLVFLFQFIKKRTRKFALKNLLLLLNIVYFLYQIFWGMLYFQTPISKKMRAAKITLELKKSLAEEMLAKCKMLREHVSEDKNGIFCIKNLSKTQKEIIHQQNALPEKLTKKKFTAQRSVKPSLFGNVMSFTGILGYYNPFTAEAQYNAALPHTYLPFTIAHESAHQLGFAREQEANFVGYLLGEKSFDKDLKYSTSYFALKSLLNAIVKEDPAFVKKIVSEYSSGMQRDRNAELLFAKKHRGFLAQFFGFSNDLFLKSNRQEGAVTYSYFVELLMQHELSKL